MGGKMIASNELIRQLRLKYHHYFTGTITVVLSYKLLYFIANITMNLVALSNLEYPEENDFLERYLVRSFCTLVQRKRIFILNDN